jgi:alpha-tubulin suppressor-like RCC1 family protein
MLLMVALTTTLAQVQPRDPWWIVTSYATELSAGASHTCMINTCGQVQCWGRNDFGQASPPAGSFTQVTAGARHTCGLRPNGSVTCWGNNLYGQLNLPTTGVTTFSAIEAGSYHTCAITTTGTTRCWGFNGDGRAAPPAPVTVDLATATSAGGGHSCSLLYYPWGTDIVCWGLDNYGQVSDVPRTYHPLIDEHLQITTGQLHSCTVSAQGSLKCWGNDSYGQTSGIGAHPNYPTSSWAVEEDPGVFLFPYSGWFDVSAGDWHTCALNPVFGTNNAKCWGYNGSGRTSPPSGTFQTVSAGGAHTCGILEDGTVSCWGSNSYGQTSPPVLPGTCSLLQWQPRPPIFP